MFNYFNYIIWDVGPILVDLGILQIRAYSLFFALGFVVSYFIIKRYYKQEGVPIRELDTLTVWVVVGGLLGARLGHCIFYDWEYYSKNLLEILLPVSFSPKFEFIGYQGLASHGGAIGIIIAILIYYRKSTKKSFFWLIDRIAVPTGFAGALIRLGNLFNSEIYGHQTDLPWGFVFIRNGDTFPSHPTQLYEAICYIITSIVLMRLYKVERFRNAGGFLLGVFFIMVFTARFFIEFVKENQVAFEDSMALNMGQILSIPVVVAGIFLVVRALKLSKAK
ncbi:MAG: prolipoprotein diacylglyceryl transferase [Bacteroidota bacterium]|jgi:prolipoprotein diacylglyceryl transferase|nr:prolipoprotein diacylglyceryl transferase [Bacteroidales bacterium]MDI9536029.1 prolipoprotein diacylglyceryl transferase [Bacteroidota bacterium]NLP20826.1 prolipoprotein diacylglyceryl transferase [Bacteroidales bacterium]HNY44044.1 prolipoprotein diacylglyceryl transferase [Bacteroidales bacterium]HOD89322.1 prolipoprotein diacylglyceryl transferase [Bacteroidales bacterium]